MTHSHAASKSVARTSTMLHVASNVKILSWTTTLTQAFGCGWRISRKKVGVPYMKKHPERKHEMASPLCCVLLGRKRCVILLFSECSCWYYFFFHQLLLQYGDTVCLDSTHNTCKGPLREKMFLSSTLGRDHVTGKGVPLAWLITNLESQYVTSIICPS